MMSVWVVMRGGLRYIIAWRMDAGEWPRRTSFALIAAEPAGLVWSKCIAPSSTYKASEEGLSQKLKLSRYIRISLCTSSDVRLHCKSCHYTPPSLLQGKTRKSSFV